MKSIYSNIFYSTTKYVMLKNIFMVITGVIGIFIVRLLGPFKYGQWSLVWQLIGTIGPIISLGWLTSLAKFIPEKNEQGKKELFSKSIFSVLLSGLIFGVLFLALCRFLPRYVPQEIKQVNYIFAVFVILIALFNIFEGMYRGLGKFNEFTVIDGLRSNLGSVLAIILLVYVSQEYQTILMSNFIFAVIFCSWILIYFKKYFAGTSLKVEKQVVNFNIVMLFGQVLLLLGTMVDSVLLRALLKDPAQVGYYNAGVRIPRMLETMLISPLTTPFLFYFSHPDTAQSKEKILVFGSKMLGIILGIIALFLFSFGKEIIILLFGGTYFESVLVLRIYSLSLSIFGFLALISSYFMSKNKPIIGVAAGVACLICILSFNLILIPRLKFVAPAISIILGLTVQTIILLCILWKEKVKMVDIFLKLFGCLAVSAASGFFISYYLALPMFVFCVLATRLFVMEDIRKLKKIVKP